LVNFHTLLGWSSLEEEKDLLSFRNEMRLSTLRVWLVFYSTLELVLESSESFLEYLKLLRFGDQNLWESKSGLASSILISR
jgi:hypothetical protein